MPESPFREIDRDLFRKNFNHYTRKAFLMLPELAKPRILDIGCGSGIPTIELAKLSKGEIIGIDINQADLDKLNNKIKIEGLGNRVTTIKCSLFEIDFPKESFDILWVEGVIAIIGFERGLKEWGRLLKANGFLVIHDDIKDKEKKLQLIPSCGYKLLNYFSLPDDAWWLDYYHPLEEKVKEMTYEYRNNPEALKKLREYQNEVERAKNTTILNSIFFIMQKE
ncbi:MAG: class I SAM-dependent methyltransferase [Promethearchaeota archaeon]